MLLQPADLDLALPGAGRWHEAVVDMQPAWLRRQCERGPTGDDGQSTAAAGARPSDEVTQAWMRGDVVTLQPGEFATTEALRWADGAGGAAGGGGGQAAAAWVADVAAEASRCEGAVVVDALEPSDVDLGGGVRTAVVARPPSSPADATWSAIALVAAGPTAVEVSTSDAGTSAEAAGEAVAALLEVTAAQLLAADEAVRLSEVGGDALAPFSDSAAQEGVPPLHTVGPPPEVPLATTDDVAAAFRGLSTRWAGLPQTAIGAGWLRSWCDPEGWLSLDVGQPAEVGGLWVPEGASWPDGPPVVVDVDVLRWSSEAVGPPGGSAGYTWAEAVRADAAGCARTRPTAAGALPGPVTSAVVTEGDDGARRLQVLAAGDATAVRVRVHLSAQTSAADADSAATSAAALARRVVANVVRADAAALAAAPEGTNGPPSGP